MQKCPKCDGEMEKGRLYGRLWVTFHSDEERKKLIGKGIRVTAFRCVECGYCEVYAPGDPKLFSGL